MSHVAAAVVCAQTLEQMLIRTLCCFVFVQFGNPHSRTHLYGWESEEAVEKARTQVGEAGSVNHPKVE